MTTIILMKNMTVRLKQRLIRGMMLCIACSPVVTSAQNVAQTTLSILSYVHWSVDSPTVCIVKNEEISKQLITLTHQNNYNFQFKSIESSQLKLTHCDAVFFSNTTPSTEQQFINSAMNKNILSFSSSNLECEIGSAFCLYTSKGGRTLFKLNLDSLSRSKIHVDPRVLLLARNAE